MTSRIWIKEEDKWKFEWQNMVKRKKSGCSSDRILLKNIRKVEVGVTEDG